MDIFPYEVAQFHILSTKMLPEHVTTFTPLCSHLNLHQRSNFSTHIKGGILDLVFDDSRNTTVEWMFSPYSDDFKLLIEL